MMRAEKTLVHLWIYNHDFNGISDQVYFFISALRQHGYRVSMGLKPRKTALTVVIENFSAHTRDTLISFCRETGKRVAVILTEHLDFVDGAILIHGDTLNNANDYMHPDIQFSRLRYLMDCVPYISCFLRLGDLPELKNFRAMLPGIELRSIPFPALKSMTRRQTDTVMYDLAFSGALTSHRRDVLAVLDELGFSVICPAGLVAHSKRNELNRSARIVLNIPQRIEWRWLSPMRILAGLNCGRASVSIGTKDLSRISECTFQIDNMTSQGIDILRDWIENRRELYRKAREKYFIMVQDFESTYCFPYDIFDFWSMTDPCID